MKVNFRSVYSVVYTSPPVLLQGRILNAAMPNLISNASNLVHKHNLLDKHNALCKVYVRAQNQADREE